MYAYIELLEMWGLLLTFGDEWGEPTASYKMNRLSLRNNWLKFRTSEKTTHHFRGIYGIYPNYLFNYFKKTNCKSTTCNRLDLETHLLGFGPIMPQNLPGH